MPRTHFTLDEQAFVIALKGLKLANKGIPSCDAHCKLTRTRLTIECGHTSTVIPATSKRTIAFTIRTFRFTKAAIAHKKYHTLGNELPCYIDKEQSEVCFFFSTHPIKLNK